MRKTTGIVYHYLAHYRLPIFKELMKAREIEYTLISSHKSGVNIKTIDAGLSKIPVSKGGLRWIFVKNIWLKKESFLWQKGLLYQLRKKNFDVLIFLGNMYYISTWVAVIYCKLRKKKIYMWTHGVTSNRKGFKWKLRKTFYKLSDGILLYGNNAKSVMIKNGFPENKLHVIYNSLDYEQQLKYRKLIDAELILKTRKELFKEYYLPYLVFVGRLTTQKKLNMIVEAIKSLSENNIRVNTLFVGKGDAQKELEVLIKKNNLQDNFKFYGPCYDEEKLSSLIGSADICVSPGEIGLTAMTALGYGTPVISHDDFNNQMPEYESIKPKYNGDLFKRGSTKDLADKICEWLSSTQDMPREEIQRRCYDVIDNKYNPKNQATIINRIILNND